jgi:hypothetical protein
MMLDHALAIAATGLPIFPCRPDNKRPLTENGFYDATTDREQIRKWWGEFPRALIGVRTGAASGFFVIDLDGVEHGGPCGLAAWDKLTASHAAPPTRRHETPRGGIHLFFRYDPQRPVTNRRGDLPEGIDVRGDGGYVVFPPSRLADGRAWRVPENCETDEIAVAPEWLYALIVEKPAAQPRQSANGDGDGAYAEAALANELAAVTGARRGTRNETLNRAAFSLGQFVGAGALSGLEVEDRLFGAALACGLVAADSERTVRATIRSGLDAGMRQPREIPKPRMSARQQQPEPRGEPAEIKEDAIDKEERDLMSRIVDGPTLALDPEPVVEWVVEDHIPIEHATIVSGNGGTGKTTLIAQLMAAMQIGGEWLGMKVKQGGALFVTSEEGKKDANRMLRAVLKAEGKSLAHCPNLQVISLADRDATMAAAPSRLAPLVATPLWHALERLIERKKPLLVVLDARADMYGGEENFRRHVRGFIVMLKRLAMNQHLASLLIEHPSLSGMNTGTGLSGSSDWHNGPRARLYLVNQRKRTRPPTRICACSPSPRRNFRTPRTPSTACAARRGASSTKAKRTVQRHTTRPPQPTKPSASSSLSSQPTTSRGAACRPTRATATRPPYSKATTTPRASARRRSNAP